MYRQAIRVHLLRSLDTQSQRKKLQINRKQYKKQHIYYSIKSHQIHKNKYKKKKELHPNALKYYQENLTNTYENGEIYYFQELKHYVNCSQVDL